MNRLMTLVLGVLACVLLTVPVSADDPPKKLTNDEREELDAKLLERYKAGEIAKRSNKLNEAVKAYEEALSLARRLYSKTEHPDGHAILAVVMNNLAQLYQYQGKLAEAEALFKDALAVVKRQHKGDHPNVATSLNNLARLYHECEKLAEAEPLYSDTLQMYKRLYKGDHPAIAQSLNNLGGLYSSQGKLADAETLYVEALAMKKRLYKGDNPGVATSLNNLAGLYKEQAKLVEAESLYTETLAMTKRLFKGDHPDVALALNNLGSLYHAQGKLAEAEPLLKDALKMEKRLRKDDHPYVAQSLNNLGALYYAQGKPEDAEELYTDALNMYKRLFKGEHSEVAVILNNLAQLYKYQGKLAETEQVLKDALSMTKRLFKGDHPDVALMLHNLAGLYQDQGKQAEAEELYADSLKMYKRLFKGDHPYVATSLTNLASLYMEQRKWILAAEFYTDSLKMEKRLLTGYAGRKAEGEALTFAVTQSLTRDGYLSNARLRVAADTTFDPGTAYPAVWDTKGTVARVYEQRQLQARAAAINPTAAKQLDALATARRRRAELLLAPATKDPSTLNKREGDLKALDRQIATIGEDTAAALPPAARLDRLGAADARDLQKALPADAALVDYIQYVFFEWDDTRPAGQKQKRTARFAAFVVTQDKVTWVDLDTVAKIESVVVAWLKAITDGNAVPAVLPAKVRELVWEKVRKQLPASVKTVYVCPDAELCKVPFAALPGDKPGTILLEDFALATVPHSPFLLDQLWPRDERKNPPAGALAVGGVKYDADLPSSPNPNTVAGRGDPLLKPDQKLSWRDLPGAAGETKRFATFAEGKKLPTTRLDGATATSAAVLAALPKAKYAHFATHGFFADPSFRGLFDLDEKDYNRSLRGERIGRAINSPLVMTGLVFAGANNPKTPGRGILTGESLIDLDLSGLELAVLSACETGLGNVAGGEGVFGLQRAFHYAGARNVVASLWKVDDIATAALMGEFYRNLWEKNLTPLESLRQAQLAIYRADLKQFKEMAARGIGAGTKDISNVPTLAADPKNPSAGNHPALWAAFTLSGLGR